MRKRLLAIILSVCVTLSSSGISVFAAGPAQEAGSMTSEQPADVPGTEAPAAEQPETETTAAEETENETPAVQGTETEAETDAVQETGTETETDAVQETGTETETDAVQETGTETETDAALETETETETDAALETETETETAQEPQTEAEREESAQGAENIFYDISLEAAAFSVKIKMASENYKFPPKLLMYTEDMDSVLDGGADGLIEASDLAASNVMEGNLVWLDGYKNNQYEYTGTFTGLKPNTTYRVFAADKGTYDAAVRRYSCYKKTDLFTITTESPTTEYTVSAGNLRTDAGYYYAKLSAVLSNPDGQEIAAFGFAYKTGDGTYSYDPSDGSFDEEYNEKTGVFTKKVWSLKSEERRTVYPYVKLAVWRTDGDSGGAVDYTYVYGEPAVIEPADFNKAKLETEITPLTAAAVNVSGTVDPAYSYDRLYAHVLVSDTKDGTYTKKETIPVVREEVYPCGVFSGKLADLETGKAYWIKVGIGNFDTISTLVSEPVSVTLEQARTYTLSEAFPDPAFRRLIISKLNLGNVTQVTSSQLETITEINQKANSDNTIIKSLEGIQYLTCLDTLSMSGNDFTDIKVGGLKALTSLSLKDNYLTSIPDMSSLTGLRFCYLSGNRIPASEFTSGNPKLPAPFRNDSWLLSNKSQNGRPGMNIADTYYAQGDRRPFYFEIFNTRGRPGYTATLSVDGGEAVALEIHNSYYHYLGEVGFKIPDLSITEGIHTLKLSVKASYGGEIYEETKQVNFIGDIAASEQCYATLIDNSIDVKAKIPTRSDAVSVTQVLLKDKQGITIGKDALISASPVKKSDPRYDSDTFDADFPYDRNLLDLEASIVFEDLLEAGSYDVHVITSEGEFLIPDILSVEGGACITGLDRAYDYMENDQYTYIKVTGTGIDPEQIWPALTYEGNKITEKDTYVPVSGGYVYRLRKINWPAISVNVDAGFETAGGYSYAPAGMTEKLYYYRSSKDTVVYKVVYNQKTCAMEGYFLGGAVPDGTKVRAFLFDHPQYGQVLSETTAEARNDSAQLYFTKNGSPYPYKQQPYYVKFLIEFGQTTIDEQKISHVNKSYTLEIPETVAAGSKQIKISYSDYDIPFPKEPFTAQLYRGNEKLGEKALKEENILYNGHMVKRFTGTLPSSIPFADGTKYTVRIVYQGTELAERDFYGYKSPQNKWFVSNAGAYWENDDFVVYADTPDKQSISNFNIRIYNVFGTEITGYQVKPYGKDTAGRICFTLKNLPKNRSGYYVKITHKTKGEPYNLAERTEKYYAASQYGKWIKFVSQETSMVRYPGYRGYGGVSGDEGAFPVKISVMKPGLMEALTEWTFQKSGELITKEQLSELPDPDAVYDFSILGKDGSTNNATGTIELYGSQILTVTRVTLDKASIALGKGCSFSLTAKVNPEGSGANLVFMSENPSVATVDEKGKVTAVDAGETVITASAGGKSASCIVKVLDITLDRTEVTLSKGETHQIVLNGAAGTPKYQSGNPAVAEADASGKVTATGYGLTEIKISVDGAELSLQVTVTAEIEKLVLNETSLTMKNGGEETLRARVLPLESALTETIEWKSSDPSVAEVNPGEKSTSAAVKALKEGTATITAQLGEISSSCEITVQKPAEKDAPQGLYAVTNVTPMLTDEILRADDQGWKFLLPEGGVPLYAQNDKPIWEFAAEYSEEGAYPYQAKIPVAVSQVNGLTVVCENTVLRNGETQELLGNVDTVGAAVPAEALSIRWSAKNGLVTIDNPESFSPRITAVKDGKEVLTAVLTVKGERAKGQKNVFTANYPLTVLSEDMISSIKVKNVSAGAVYDEQREVLVIPFGDGEAFQKEGAAVIETELFKGSALDTETPLKCRSLDSKVVKAAAKGRTIELNLKGEGQTTLTLTAGDRGQYTKEILVQVEDYAPKLLTNRLTVNILKLTGETTVLYTAYENTVNSVEIRDENSPSDLFAASCEGGELRIKAKSPDIKTGNYTNLQLAVTCRNGKTYKIPVQIKAVSKKPSAKLNVLEKANLFYKDSEAVYQIVCDEEIADARWDSGKQEGARLTGEYADGLLTLRPEDVTQASSNMIKQIQKGTVTIRFQDYPESCSQVISVAKAPLMIKKATLMLSEKSTLLYPGMTGNYLTLVDKTTKEIIPLDTSEDPQEGDRVSVKEIKGLSVSKENGKILLQYTGRGNPTASIFVTLSSWRDSVEIKHKITQNAQPETELAVKTLILNTDCTSESYEPHTVSVNIKGNRYARIESLNSAKGKNKKSVELLTSGALSIVPDAQNSRYLVCLNGKAAKGTYQFLLGGSMWTSDGAKELKDAVLTIKISEKAPAASVKTSGSINVLDRENTWVTCSIKMTDLTDGIEKAELTGAYSDLFRTTLTKDNKVLVLAKDGSPIRSNTNYTLKLILKLANGYILETKPFKVKPQQKAAAVAASRKNVSMHAAAYGKENAAALDFNFKKAVTGIEIDRVALVNYENAFAYDYDTGELILLEPVNGKALKGGKTYKLTFRVYFRGTSENAKATLVKVPVKLLK